MNEPSSHNPHPHVRDSDICPLCQMRKDRGIVVCWNCYHRFNLQYGNPEAQAIIDDAEAKLSGVPVVREGCPKHLWGDRTATCICGADEASDEELEAAGAFYDGLKACGCKPGADAHKPECPYFHTNIR